MTRWPKACVATDRICRRDRWRSHSGSIWKSYRRLLDSKVADINNVSDGGMAGAITAALYLDEFVSRTTPWVHFDIMGWNPSDRPGRPIGGEAMGMRALFAVIDRRFGKKRRRK